MNIEIANRLYQYRKKNNLSQEELAAKIGVSRQAVSKWERAEASPDTDNLILLAKLYGVTLDDLLQGEGEPQKAENCEQSQKEAQEEKSDDGFAPDHDANYTKCDKVSFKKGIHIHSTDGDKVDISFKDGVNVIDSDGSRVSVNRHGVNVSENGKTKVYTDENGDVHYSDDVKEKSNHKKSTFMMFPYYLITAVAYIVFGLFNICGGFAYGWIVFLTIPLYYTTVEAIIKRKPSAFCFPALVVIVYLIFGFGWGLWHPSWVIFLSIPVYYSMCSFFKHRKDN